jgi:hypothetical protein
MPLTCHPEGGVSKDRKARANNGTIRGENEVFRIRC